MMKFDLMKNMLKTFVVLMGLLLLTFSACNDPSSIGVVLPGIEPIDGIYVDDFDLSSKTVLREPVEFSLAHKLAYNFVGNIDDPVFGQDRTSFVVQGLPNGVEPDFENKYLDSVVLVMLYDTTYMMGDTNLIQNVIVEELDQDLDVLVTYNSEEDFAVKTEILGQKSFFPTPTTRTVIGSRDTLSTHDTLVPQLRIRLDDAFGQRLMDMDSLAFVEIDPFREVFKGLRLSSDTDHSSIMSYNVSSTTSKIIVYYSDTEDVYNKQTFIVPITSSAINVQKYDLTPSAEVQAFIDNPSMGDSVCFTQGMSGVSTEITFNDISSLNGFNINKAELIITERIAPNTDISLKGINFLATTERKDESGEINYYYVSDLQSAVDFNAFILYGGQPVETEIDGVMYNVYSLNLTSYIQELVNGELESNSIFLEPLGKKQVPFRSSFYGAKHSVHPMKLNVIYTPIN